MRRIGFILALGATLSSVFIPSANAAGLIVEATSKVTSNISNVGDIWTGNIPTKVSYPSDSYSEKLEFTINGILPIGVLADKANGVDVEFAIWSDSGVKLGSQTVYSFSWNPIGPNTVVSMYLSQNAALYGKHTMLISTNYTTSTTGLLSRYLKDDKKHAIEIVKVLPRKIPDTPVARGNWQNGIYEVDFDLIEANPPVSKYVLTLASLNSPTLSPTQTANYNNRAIVLEGMGEKFSLTKLEVEGYLKSNLAVANTPVVLVRVEAVNDVGYSTLSPGVYIDIKDFGIDKAADVKVAADKIVAVKKSSITCVKGKVTKKVTAVSPKCPAGYKVKK
jgi:hypothetical protein